MSEEEEVALETFEKVAAQTSTLSPRDIRDIRALFTVYADGAADVDPRTATHIMSLLGFKNEGQFPQAMGRVDFQILLTEVCQRRRTELSTEDQLRHCFRMMDPHESGAANVAMLKDFLLGIGAELSDEDAALLTDLMANALPDRFREHEFVRFMMSTGAATLRKVAENEKKRRSRVTSQRRKQQQKREAASHSSTNAGKTVDAPHA